MNIRPLETALPSTVTAAGGLAVAPAAAVEGAAPDVPATRESVSVAVAQANAALEAMNRRGLEFSIDPDTKSVVVRLVDRQDNTVLRQIPSVEMLALAKALDRMQGTLLDHRA